MRISGAVPREELLGRPAIARAADSIGRPITQYELCAPHTEQIAERERAKERGIVRREVGR